MWNENVWRRQPQIERLNVGIVEHEETLWLYQVEDSVLMVEVSPTQTAANTTTIGQVVLKRLISADQAIERLTTAQSILTHRGF